MLFRPPDVIYADVDLDPIHQEIVMQMTSEGIDASSTYGAIAKNLFDELTKLNPGSWRSTVGVHGEDSGFAIVCSISKPKTFFTFKMRGIDVNVSKWYYSK